jgi:hypothetical protein
MHTAVSLNVGSRMRTLPLSDDSVWSIDHIHTRTHCITKMMINCIRFQHEYTNKETAKIIKLSVKYPRFTHTHACIVYMHAYNVTTQQLKSSLTKMISSCRFDQINKYINILILSVMGKKKKKYWVLKIKTVKVYYRLSRQNLINKINCHTPLRQKTVTGNGHSVKTKSDESGVWTRDLSFTKYTRPVSPWRW